MLGSVQDILNLLLETFGDFTDILGTGSAEAGETTQQAVS